MYVMYVYNLYQQHNIIIHIIIRTFIIQINVCTMNNLFRSLMKVPKLTHRNLLEIPPARQKVWLPCSELHPKDWMHVQIMSKKEFLDFYKLEQRLFVIKEAKTMQRLRLLTIVPFIVKEDEILPFPFLVDTGAPRTMYLGRKMS